MNELLEELAPSRASFEVGTYSDGSGPVVTVEYDVTSKHTPQSVWVYGGDTHSDHWVAFDWQYADAIADAIKQAAASLRARSHK